MSRVQRDRYRRKLRELLSRSDDESFIQLLWAIDALQSGRETAARRFVSYPPEAASADIASQLAIYKWELETLANLLLTTRKPDIREGPTRVQRCDVFYSGSNATAYLRKLENAEYGLFRHRYSVLMEMHRIGHRQFQWQRGFGYRLQLYRFTFIYGGEDCATFLSRLYGMSLSDFILAGFGLYAGLQSEPWLRSDFRLEEVGLTSDLIAKTLEIVAKPIKCRGLSP